MNKLALLAAGLLAVAVPGQSALALGTPPCSSVPSMPAINIIPLSNGIATYCVSDYGWTDTWFVGSSPGVYDPRFDVLSGDDAPNLHFGILGGAPWEVVTGLPAGGGWISPILDRGELEPVIPTLSPWTVTTAVHLTGASTAESLVHHPEGLDLLITTTLGPGQAVTQTFRITNTTTGTTFEDVVFADYFNYHPNGSTAVNAQKGTVSYDPLSGITITGIDDGTLIATGNMRGERVDDAGHGMNAPGFITTPIAVWDMVQTIDYNNPPTGVFSGPGDVAGALAWNLPDLDPGESTSFTIFKLSTPLVAAPEPVTLAFFAGGLALLVWGGARRRSFKSATR